MMRTVKGAARLLVWLLLGALLVPPATARAEEKDRSWRPWICVYTEDEVKSDKGTVETKQGVYIYDGHLLCYRDTSEVPLQVVVEAPFQHFLDAAGLDWQDALKHQLGAVLCHDGAVGAVSLGRGLPSLDEAKESCAKPVTPAGVGGGGGESGPGATIPDLFGSGSGVPSSSSISCSASGAGNPYADAPDGGVRHTSDGDIATGFLASWATGVAVIWGSSKGAGTATTLAGAGVATGAGGVGIVAWGTNAANTLGNLMEGRYRDAATSLANEATGLAQAAEANAQAAQMAADASGDPAAQEAADRARAAADAAKKAADRAQEAAKQAAEAKTRREAAAAYEAAKKAAEEAKQKNKDAAKANQDAQNQNQPPANGASTAPSPGTNGTPADQNPNSTCENLRRQVWECEQSGWKTFDCQQLARLFQGCSVDMTIALVDGDSAVCGNPVFSTKELTVAHERACGMLVAHPVPGQDPCDLAVEGSPEIRGSCDPTVAYGGCPEEEPVVIKGDDTICFPAPPSVPPMPCVDPTPGDGPPMGGVLMDDSGGVYLATPGGILGLGEGYPPGRP